MRLDQATGHSPCAIRLGSLRIIRKYVYVYGADNDIAEFFRMFWDRRGGSKRNIAKGMEALFLVPRNNARAASKNRSRRSAPDNVDRTPQQVRFATARDEHIVEVPRAIRLASHCFHR
jgi:hypothetical protein